MLSSTATMPLQMQVKMMNICISNDELCIQHDGLCIENDEFCIQNDEFFHQQ